MSLPPPVGVAVIPFNGITPADLLRGLRLLGIEFVELNRTAFDDLEGVRRRLGSMQTAFHLPLKAFDGWDFSSAEHQNQIDDLIARLNEAAVQLRIRHAVVHPPEPHNDEQPSADALRVLFSNLKRLNLPIHLENVATTSPQDMERLLAEARAALGDQFAGMCFDASHFFITGHDPVRCFYRFRRRIASVHLSDSTPEKDDHLSFGCGGSLPVEELLAMMARSDFAGTVTLEITPPSLSNLEPYVESYLTTLRYLDYGTFMKKRLRLFALNPLISRFQSRQLNPEN